MVCDVIKIILCNTTTINNSCSHGEAAAMKPPSPQAKIWDTPSAYREVMEKEDIWMGGKNRKDREINKNECSKLLQNGQTNPKLKNS